MSMAMKAARISHGSVSPKNCRELSVGTPSLAMTSLTAATASLGEQAGARLNTWSRRGRGDLTTGGIAGARVGNGPQRHRFGGRAGRCSAFAGCRLKLSARLWAASAAAAQVTVTVDGSADRPLAIRYRDPDGDFLAVFAILANTLLRRPSDPTPEPGPSK
jgi:hypothetical protein